MPMALAMTMSDPDSQHKEESASIAVLCCVVFVFHRMTYHLSQCFVLKASDMSGLGRVGDAVLLSTFLSWNTSKKRGGRSCALQFLFVSFFLSFFLCLFVCLFVSCFLCFFLCFFLSVVVAIGMQLFPQSSPCMHTLPRTHQWLRHFGQSRVSWVQFAHHKG